jgi:hypothetical protein
MTNKEMEARIKALEEENEQLKGLTAPVNTPIILPNASMTPLIPYEEKEYVKIKLFKDDYRYKRPLYVSINGRNWLIPRGVEVTLPKYVADFIDHMSKEEAEIQERILKEEQEYRDLTAKQV